MNLFKNHKEEHTNKVPGSLAKRIALLSLFAVVLPVFLLSLYASIFTSENMRNAAYESYETCVQNMKNTAEKHISNADEIMRILEDSYSIRQTLWQIRSSQRSSEGERANLQGGRDLEMELNLPYTFMNVFGSPQITSVCLFYDNNLQYYFINNSLDAAVSRCSSINTQFLGEEIKEGQFVMGRDSQYAYYIRSYRNIYTNKYTGTCVIELSQIPDTDSTYTDSPESRFSYCMDLTQYENTNYCIYNEEGVITFTNNSDYIGARLEKFIPKKLSYYLEEEGAQLSGRWMIQTVSLGDGLKMSVYAKTPGQSTRALRLLLGGIIAYLCLVVYMYWRLIRGVSAETEAYYALYKNSKQAYPPVHASCKETSCLFEIIREDRDTITALEENLNTAGLDKQKEKVKILEKQINPHVYFNMLEQINWCAIREGDTKVSTMIESYATMLRNNMSYAEQDSISLRSEITYTRSYLELQQKQGMEFDYDFNVDRDLLDVYQVPKYILQPIVENSIVHGFCRKAGRGRITIEIWEDMEGLMIRVSDNGKGFDTKSVKEDQENYAGDWETSFGNHLALGNIRKRLRLLYGESGGIRIESVIGVGTEVTIWIPSRQIH